MKYKYLLIVVIFILLFHFGKSFKSSLFFQDKDRINILFYGESSRIYSIGLNDKVNYFIYFPTDLDVLVPGGYGFYRVGALGKLISLERKPELYRQTFSLNTSFFVNYFFYERSSNIYYGNNIPKKPYWPSFKEFFFNNSSTDFWDKLYIYINFKLVNSGSLKLTPINVLPTFSDEEFFKRYQGFFYQKRYRDEARNIQIIYNSDYNTAQSLSRLLEGEGIRVVDLSKADNNIKKCNIIEDGNNFSQTAKNLADFFQCRIEKGKTQVSDIVFYLGDVEKQWEVK